MPGSNGCTKVKNWICARAKFSVRTQPGIKKRYQKLLKDRQVLEVGLSRSPYVGVTMGNESCRALVDTGADWSMLDYSCLSEEERGSLVESGMRGQGVSKETIKVKGEVWRNVVLDGIPVTNQRFVVIDGLVTRMILGADFWVRLGEITLDFAQRRLRIEKLGINTELHETDTLSIAIAQDAGRGNCRVTLDDDVTIPCTQKLLSTASWTMIVLKDSRY